MSMQSISLACFLVVLSGSAVAAQNSRDDWKLQKSTFDLRAHLTHSLAEAPLTSAERAQIYETVDNRTIRSSFTDSQRDEERKTVLSARVGEIALAEDGSQQVLVQGPASFCGASGNCPIWVFIRQRDRLQLILEAGGGALILRGTSNHGFRDVATGWHMSAEQERIAVYRWNGTKYEQVDCYGARFDLDNRDKPPVITDCEPAPR